MESKIWVFAEQRQCRLADVGFRKHHPEIYLSGATAMGTDLSARLAAKLRTGLSAHCIGLELSSEKKLLAVVPGWGGNVMARVYSPNNQPQMATAMPGVFEMPQKRKPEGK